ncbi:MAG: NAD(P)-dependent oxidoreductase [Anaerolineae bacterium]|nr:NAD(P)-dependent oxidoreductase [Anaerolineae bacterium]
MMSRVILVTGGAGYIGSRLIRDLAADPDFAGDTIRLYDNLQRETYTSLLDLPPEGRYQFIEGDILDHAGVRRALQDVWAVVHMAAIVRTPLSFGPTGWIEQVNHWGTANLIDAAAAAGVDFFVYTSSAAVYGPVDAVIGGPLRQPRPFKEDDICRPVGLYAESKLRAENHLRTAAEQGRIRTAILRLAPVYGLAPSLRFDAVANRFVYLTSVHRPLTVYGDGNQIRPQLHVSDASGVIRFALTHPAEMAGQTFNAAAENISVLELAQAVQAQRPDVKIRYTEQDVLTHLSYAIDSSRLNAMGWYPRISLEAGLAELLDHMHSFEPFHAGDFSAFSDL